MLNQVVTKKKPPRQVSKFWLGMEFRLCDEKAGGGDLLFLRFEFCVRGSSERLGGVSLFAVLEKCKKAVCRISLLLVFEGVRVLGKLLGVTSIRC